MKTIKFEPNSSLSLFSLLKNFISALFICKTKQRGVRLKKEKTMIIKQKEILMLLSDPSNHLAQQVKVKTMNNVMK